MKRFAFTAIAAATAAAAITAVAAPAAAQPYGYDRRDHDSRYDGYRGRDHQQPDWDGRWRIGVNERRAQLERRIEINFQRGRLSPAEAAELRREVWRLERLTARYGRIDGGERADLHSRMDRLEYRLQRDVRDGDHRDYGYGYRR